MNPAEQQPQQPQQPEQPQQPVQPAQPVFQATPPQMAQPAAPDTNSFQAQPKVQYVVMQKSLEGLGGWLAFFLVIFSLTAIGYFSSTFKSPAGLHTATDPLLAIGFLLSVVMVSLRKKAALWVIYGTLILSFVVSVINSLITMNANDIGLTVGAIVASLIFDGLLALYFFASKRVKATLVR